MSVKQIIFMFIISLVYCYSWNFTQTIMLNNNYNYDYNQLLHKIFNNETRQNMLMYINFM